MATAKNSAIDMLRRERTARTLAPEVRSLLERENDLSTGPSDQLRMMFSCCHPRLHEEAQVALVLHILCGFSVGEISSAFLSSEAAVKKRITRAKKVLAHSKRLFELTDTDFAVRLSAVHRALYLLFNEGYHGASPESAIRAEPCREAVHLAGLLRDHPLTSTPATYALLALMCLHAARLPGRIDDAGELTMLVDQDRSRWDSALLAEGTRLLDLSATGTELSEYHIEAAIASVHAEARRPEDTAWETIVSLYDMLMAIRPSPVVALGRALAIAEARGPDRGLEAVHAIADPDRLAGYPFYSAALGELALRSGKPEVARAHLRTALSLARSPAERRLIERRLTACGQSGP